MNHTFEDKFAIIRESFKAGGADFLDVSGSLRVDFKSGHEVYIYGETYDNAITARFETKENDPEKRRQEAEKLREVIVREIVFADISQFQEAQSFNKRFVYKARVDIDESVFFHETIVIGDSKTDHSDFFVVQEEEQERLSDLFEPETQETDALSVVEKAVAQLETVDAKMLRQSLDMMNLKRSSNVRIALNRIFRSAADAEELKLAIQSEASKLTSQNDLEDLRIIKTIHTDGFLEPVISLLHEEVFAKQSGS